MHAPPPSILQIFNEYLQKGGEESSVDRIYTALQQNGNIMQCRFASADWVGPHPMSTFQQALRMIYNPESIRKLKLLDNQCKPDAWLLHNVFPVGSAGVFREAIRRKVPVIYYIHNFRPFSVSGYLWANGSTQTAGLQKNFWPEIRAGAWQSSRIKTAWYALILRSMHALKYFDHITTWIAISDFMRDVFIEAGIPESKIRTLPHSWNAMPSAPKPQDLGYYVFLGRLVEMKGIPTLLKAWALLEDHLGTNCPVLRIGGQGPLESEVRRAAAASSKIEYLGHVSGEQKHQLLCGCRAFLAPSIWWEPLGLVTYEAYDYGKPMLAARSGGLTETVQHQVTGFLHTPGNARELAEQILEIDSDSQRRLEMGQKGRAWLMAHTRPEDWLRNFNAICHETLRKHER